MEGGEWEQNFPSMEYSHHPKTDTCISSLKKVIEDDNFGQQICPNSSIKRVPFFVFLFFFLFFTCPVSWQNLNEMVVPNSPAREPPLQHKFFVRKRKYENYEIPQEITVITWLACGIFA